MNLTNHHGDMLIRNRMSDHPDSPANSTQGLLEMVMKYIKASDHIVEIGCFEGSSTIIFATFGEHVDAVDPYEFIGMESKRSLVKAEKTFIKQLSKYSNVTKIKKQSKEYFAGCSPETVDFVYIDGDHSHLGVISDIQNAMVIVKTGGYIAGHDYYEGVKVAVNSILKPIEVFCDASWIYQK